MRALPFAIATVNLASQNGFLFLATHRDGPIFIAPSSSATLLVIQCAVVGRARWPSYHPRRSQIYAHVRVARWQSYRRSSLGPCVVNCSRAFRRPSSLGQSGSSPRGVGNETAFQKKAMRRTRARWFARRRASGKQSCRPPPAGA